MSTKAKLFPRVPKLVLALITGLALGCGAASTETRESPCERTCADGFVACIERCGDEGACRDECMAERAECAHGCAAPDAPPGDAGATPG